MNERIRELALQAFQPINDITSEGVADFHTFEQSWFQMYNQKFAELIVRECAKVAFNDWCEGTNEASSQMAILKHFRVEE